MVDAVVGLAVKLHIQRVNSQVLQKRRVVRSGSQRSQRQFGPAIGAAAGLTKLMRDYVPPLYAFRARRKGYEVSAMKSCMDLIGLTGGPVRPPLPNVRPEEIAELRAGIEAGMAKRRSSDLLIQQGLLEMREGRHAAARTALEEALQLNPLDIRAMEGLRRSYVAQNQPAVAVQKVQDYAAGRNCQ